MRKAGTIPKRYDVERLTDYLLTQEIKVRVDEDQDEYSIWILDEAQLQRGKQELAAFRDDAENAKYAAAQREAETIRRATVKRDKRVADATIHMRRRWERPTGAKPLTLLLILISCGVTLASDFGRKPEPVITYLGFTEITVDAQGHRMWYKPGIQQILGGEVWRLVTPIFIHLTVMGIPFMHLLFNMLWLNDLGGQIEIRKGSLKLLAMVLVIAAVSNLAQYFWKGPHFGGMSGVVYGLFGYAWMKSKFDPASGIALHPNIVILMIVWFFMCAFNLVGNVANMAHGAGLVVGVVIGYAPCFWRRMTRV